MVRATIGALAAFSLGLSAISPVGACPLCESDAGERVRSGIFGGDFGYHLAETLLPFLAFVAIIGLIHFGPPWPRRQPRPVGGPRPSKGGGPMEPVAGTVDG